MTAIRRLWRRFVCLVRWHDWQWQAHADRPMSIRCRRCGRCQERGLEYLLTVIIGRKP